MHLLTPWLDGVSEIKLEGIRSLDQVLLVWKLLGVAV